MDKDNKNMKLEEETSQEEKAKHSSAQGSEEITPKTEEGESTEPEDEFM